MNNRIKLSENNLHKIIREAVKKIINEGYSYQEWDREHFIEFVYDYLNAQDVINGTLFETPFGDLKYRFTDDNTLQIAFGSEEDAAKLNDEFIDQAEDVYELVHKGNSVFVRLKDYGDKEENKNNGKVFDTLNDINEKLVGITNSGFIPFVSPYPSSSELELKNAIVSAQESIAEALSLCKSLGFV